MICIKIPMVVGSLKTWNIQKDPDEAYLEAKQVQYQQEKNFEHATASVRCTQITSLFGDDSYQDTNGRRVPVNLEDPKRSR